MPNQHTTPQPDDELRYNPATGSVIIPDSWSPLADRVSPPPPAPSQGQEIPADQLQALIHQGLALIGQNWTTDHVEALRAAIRSTYRIGFAAALGWEITVEDGRVGVGDRLGPAAVPGLDWHGLRSTIEHAITARLGKAWPEVFEADPVFAEQVAAETSSAALGVPLLAQIVARTAQPVTPTADLADEAAHERVARAIVQATLDPAGIETEGIDDAWADPYKRNFGYRAAKAAIDAYRASQPRADWRANYEALRGEFLDVTDELTKARAHIGHLTTALDEAARDAHEAVELDAVYDGGLSTDETRRVEALHIGAEAINGAQWSEDFNNAISALLAEAPRVEAYIRDGAEPDETAVDELWQRGTHAQKAYAHGYAEAVRRLRDRDRYETWYAHHQYRQGLPQRSIYSPSASNGLAEYLEDTAPDPGDPWADTFASKSPRCTCQAGAGEHPHTARGCDVPDCCCRWTPPPLDDDASPLEAWIAQVAPSNPLEEWQRDVLRRVSPPADSAHAYTSTACHHGQHQLCKLNCKYCGASCGCSACEHSKADTAPSNVEDCHA